MSTMGLMTSIREYGELIRLQKKLAKVFPSFKEQHAWLQKFRQVDAHVKTAHNPSHVLQFILAIFNTPESVEGCIVEAGAFKGGSTAKISLAAAHMNRPFYVFDSFCGLPENKEQHIKSVMGHSIQNWFDGGNFAGTLDEVKGNVQAYGNINVCEFVPGWFNETMPLFNKKIALAYLDVDLAESTRTCLKYLFPLLSPGGAIYSQDGDFPLVIEVFRDQQFWMEELGCEKMPVIENLGKKITIIRK